MKAARIIKNYKITSSDISGGGTLFIAEHLQLGKNFYIKTISPALSNDPKFRDRFYGEAKLLARLSHPNILQATDFFEYDGHYYLVMEYFNGSSLERLIHIHKRFSERAAVYYFMQLLRGLDFAHEKQIIHRNICSSVILLDKSGNLKITDFGVAMIKGDQMTADMGLSCSDPGFISPEQIVSPKNVDQRSDIYSAGVVLFYMLSGKLPFEKDSSLSTLMLHLDEPAPDIRTVRGDVSPPLAEIVAKALEKSPENRFSDCKEFLQALKEYQKNLVSPMPPDTDPPAKRQFSRRSMIITGAALVAGLMTGLLGYRYFTVEKYVTVLRIHGSNTIGSRLVPSLAEAYLRRCGATKVVRTPGKDREEIVVKGLMEKRRGIAVEIRSHGSSTAFEGLAAGTCDIGMSSRRIKDDEVAKLAGLGDLTSPASEHILGLDGVAVIVNEANALKSLGIADVKGIFSGATRTWSQVGGADRAINVYARNDNSGTYDTFKSLVMKDSTLYSGARRIEDSEILSTQVSTDRDGIGFIGLPYVRSAKAISITSGDSLPVYPTPFTIATEDYPLSRRLYLYTASTTANPKVAEFLEFALSQDGQEIVEKTGFVSLLVKAGTFPLPDNAPADYTQAVSGAERLSLNFKFRTNSLKLDNKGLRDLDRLIGALAGKEFQGRPVILLGFTDNSRPMKESMELSRLRAQLVAKELIQRGVSPAVVSGFGYRIPVADNATTDGMNRNNRVEIWLGEK